MDRNSPSARAPISWVAVLCLCSHVRTADCDLDGVPDAEQIAGGSSADCDSNGVPDECDLATSFELRAARRFPVSSLPRTVVAADLDVDGQLDLVVALVESLVVLRGQGDREFTKPAPIPGYQGGANWVLAPDLDSDGRPDLVVANDAKSAIVVLLGNGDGTFSPGSQVPVGDYPYSGACPDLNGDSVPDLAVADREGRTISVALGLGAGEFSAAETIRVSGTLSSLIAEDLDGDGDIDLAAGSMNEAKVYFVPGNGDGTFGPVRELPSETATCSLTAADIDEDGDLDMIALNFAYTLDTRLSVLLGAAGGTFEAAPTLSIDYRANGSYDHHSTVLLRDIDGDGHADLVVSGGVFEILILPGRGDGSFGEPRKLITGRDPRRFIATDLDLDGGTDLVVLNAISLDVGLIYSRAEGGLVAGSRYVLDGPAYWISSGDFDEDGWADLIAAGPGPAAYILRGAGAGTFATPLSIDTQSGLNGGAAGDFDGDGKADFIVLTNRSEFLTFLGRGDLTFESPRETSVPAVPSDWTLADLDSSGTLDLAGVSRDASLVWTLFGAGDGSFEAGQTYPATDPPVAVLVADLNADGIPDLLAGGGSSTLTVRLGLGGGALGAASSVTIADTRAVSTLATGDFDEDGRVDFLTSRSGSRGLALLPGRGDGTFEDARTVPSPWYLRNDPVVADLDRDGHLDLVGTGFDTRDVALFLGRGDGTFRSTVRYACADQTMPPHLVDVDGDGYLDLVAPGLPTRDIWVLGGALRPPRQQDCNRNGIPDVCDVRSGTSLDADGDGVPDECGGGLQLPADCNQDARFDVSDAVCVFRTLFLGDPPTFPCGDGLATSPGNLSLLDWGEDGAVGISDGIAALRFLFLDGPPHPLATEGWPAGACVLVPGCPASPLCR